MTLSLAVREALNKANDWAVAKNKLGDLVHGGMNVLKANYKFSQSGGAVGDITLKDQDGIATALSVPSGAIVVAGFVHVNTALTSGGLATLDLNLEAANDLLAAEAVASFSTGAKIALIPDFATLADSVVTTAARSLTLSINTATLLTGDLDVFLFYVF